MCVSLCYYFIATNICKGNYLSIPFERVTNIPYLLKLNGRDFLDFIFSHSKFKSMVIANVIMFEGGSARKSWEFLRNYHRGVSKELVKVGLG